jgi:hypothetical protein
MYCFAGLVLAVLVCWVPFSVIQLVVAACEDCLTDMYVLHFCHWMLWLKSCFNPFLYACNSPRFRRNFKQLLSPFPQCLIFCFLCFLPTLSSRHRNGR